MHCTHGASHDPRVSLFFVHVVCSVKFDRPNQATTNDKSVGQLGTPSFDQLVQFIYILLGTPVQLVIGFQPVK